MLDYLIFKEINELFASGQMAKGKRLLMELQSRCIALRDEMSMLKIRMESLEEALFYSKNLFFEHGFYWLRVNGIKQGPYCTRCYDLDGALIHLQKNPSLFYCPYCHEKYWIKETVQDSQRHARILHFVR